MKTPLDCFIIFACQENIKTNDYLHVNMNIKAQFGVQISHI